MWNRSSIRSPHLISRYCSLGMSRDVGREMGPVRVVLPLLSERWPLNSPGYNKKKCLQVVSNLKWSQSQCLVQFVRVQT